MFLERYHERASKRTREPRHVRSRPASPDRSSAAITAALVVFFLGAIGMTAWWWYTTQPTDPVADAAGSNQPTSTLNRATQSDRDGDRLPDDLELVYGTDPQAADTDQDNFSDGQEVDSGFDPRVAGGTRMVDFSLVERLGQQTSSPVIISSGLASGDRQRYYFVYDGRSTTYYGADGSVVVQCDTAIEPLNDCTLLPNQVRTDFSRNFSGASTTDSFYLPF